MQTHAYILKSKQCGCKRELALKAKRDNFINQKHQTVNGFVEILTDFRYFKIRQFNDTKHWTQTWKCYNAIIYT